VIRQRLGAEIYQGVFEVVLSALKAYGLFRGRHLGIDSSVIEAMRVCALWCIVIPTRPIGSM
jgi:hypothetical protein